jgi:hypothetical protein
MKPLRKGEYDLANISLLGRDPVTGRSFAECDAEWRAALEKLKARHKARRWWDLVEMFRINRQAAIMAQRLGF